MTHDLSFEIFMCPRCLVAQIKAGTCPECHVELITCHPGAENDPCRRPLMNADGQVLSRAPLWWLAHSASSVVAHFEDNHS
jgi:hypothetical protein